jgi:hypothetical protein
MRRDLQPIELPLGDSLNSILISEIQYVKYLIKVRGELMESMFKLKTFGFFFFFFYMSTQEGRGDSKDFWL